MKDCKRSLLCFFMVLIFLFSGCAQQLPPEDDQISVSQSSLPASSSSGTESSSSKILPTLIPSIPPNTFPDPPVMPEECLVLLPDCLQEGDRMQQALAFDSENFYYLKTFQTEGQNKDAKAQIMQYDILSSARKSLGETDLLAEIPRVSSLEYIFLQGRYRCEIVQKPGTQSVVLREFDCAQGQFSYYDLPIEIGNELYLWAEYAQIGEEELAILIGYANAEQTAEEYCVIKFNCETKQFSKLLTGEAVFSSEPYPIWKKIASNESELFLLGATVSRGFGTQYHSYHIDVYSHDGIFKEKLDLNNFGEEFQDDTPLFFYCTGDTFFVQTSSLVFRMIKRTGSSCEAIDVGTISDFYYDRFSDSCWSEKSPLVELELVNPHGTLIAESPYVYLAAPVLETLYIYHPLTGEMFHLCPLRSITKYSDASLSFDTNSAGDLMIFVSYRMGGDLHSDYYFVAGEDILEHMEPCLFPQ